MTRYFDAPSPNWQRGHRGVDLAGVTGQPVYPAAGGTVGLALWFRPARRISHEPRQLRILLWVFAVICLGIYLGIYLVDNEELPRPWEMTINTALTAVALVVLRSAVQLALLHEAPDPRTDRTLRCEHCGQAVPDMPFCQVCGAAFRASSESSPYSLMICW